ncbi:UNKNOWN [Stylonychia lemnae]|uniref:Transmembrane protein n=1 Tax=Stylonychia lemnae TaxID=5949 RepID=A0A077ZPA0_STYLE|nr:UNKNOWN [Stylonychia lemnae]|eukprot:CDW71284.1 UNKNOWN [Stylonychia lemnae]
MQLLQKVFLHQSQLYYYSTSPLSFIIKLCPFHLSRKSTIIITFTQVKLLEISLNVLLASLLVHLQLLITFLLLQLKCSALLQSRVEFSNVSKEYSCHCFRLPKQMESPMIRLQGSVEFRTRFGTIVFLLLFIQIKSLVSDVNGYLTQR